MRRTFRPFYEKIDKYVYQTKSFLDVAREALKMLFSKEAYMISRLWSDDCSSEGFFGHNDAIYVIIRYMSYSDVRGN